MDPRDRYAEFGDYPDGTTFDEKTMILHVPLFVDCEEEEVVEEEQGDEEEFVAFKCRFEVCNLCHGKGSHVNPSIDAHGLSAEDFAEDPDFADDYREGMYDQPCNRCHGKRVVPEIIRPEKVFCRHCNLEITFGTPEIGGDDIWHHNEHGGITCGSPAPEEQAEPHPDVRELLDDLKRLDNWMEGHQQYMAEVAAERRMGA